MAIFRSGPAIDDHGSEAGHSTRSLETTTPCAELPRVLIFAFIFPPSASAGTFRTLRFVRYLSTCGWKPLVLTARTSYFAGKPIDWALNEWVPSETIVQRTIVLRPVERLATGVRWLLPSKKPGQPELTKRPPANSSSRRFKSFSNPVRSTLRSLKKLLSTPDQQVGWILPAFTAALRLIRHHRPQILYSSGPPHSSHLAALLVKKLTGLPLVLDFRDPWAHCDWDSDDTALIARIHKRLESLCVSGADRLILNTESLCHQFRENYPAQLHHKFVAITNGYDPELRRRIETLLADSHADSESNGSGEFRLLHAGAVYGERRLEPLVEAIALLNSRGHRIRLEQIGRIADKAPLERAIEQLQATSFVKLTNHRPHDEVMRYMAAADAHVLLQPGTTIQIPGKLFEMMMFGKPIFAFAGPGETTNIIREYDLGTAITTEDAQVIAKELERLVVNYPRQVSTNATALTDFDGRRLTAKLASVFDSLTSEQDNEEESEQ